MMSALALMMAAAAPAAPVEVRLWSASSLPAGATIAPDGAGQGRASIRIANPGQPPGLLRATVAVFRRPALATPYWSVRGRVRTERVAGPGFLEMWSTLADGSSFFSRTLALAGPMQNLEGTQGWRDFSLPFQSEPGRPEPVELKVNVVLPGAGAVELGPLELRQHDSPASLFSISGAASPAWFTGSQAGLAGGIGGSLVGLLGAAIGWLSSRGRARRLVLGALAASMAGGAALLAAAGVAAGSGQPRDVWLTLGLLGLASGLVAAAVFRSTAARYRDLELRRMRALDT